MHFVYVDLTGIADVDVNNIDPIIGVSAFHRSLTLPWTALASTSWHVDANMMRVQAYAFS